MSGKRSCRIESCRYSGRKSCPHCETQCASSIANKAIGIFDIWSRKRSVNNRSGATYSSFSSPREHASFDIALRERVETRIQERRFDAELAQCRDLVLHQRDQRRHDDRSAIAQQRRNLIAQRFSAAGRHQHERIAAANDLRDDGFLISPKRRVTENAAQHVHRLCHAEHRSKANRYAAHGNARAKVRNCRSIASDDDGQR